jgi:hypothetical protein
MIQGSKNSDAYCITHADHSSLPASFFGLPVFLKAKKRSNMEMIFLSSSCSSSSRFKNNVVSASASPAEIRLLTKRHPIVFRDSPSLL